jgi:spore coat polysaccharide biosynthesis protein SpsF
MPGQPLEVTVYPAAVLIDAEQRAADPVLREHVSLHMTRHPERYRLCNLEAPPWFRNPELYLEVDTREDFEVISAIFEHFYPSNPGFGLWQVIEFMTAHPELADRNRFVERRWKIFRHDG